MFSSMFEPWSYKLCPLHTCRQYHSKSPVSLTSVCYWSCLSVYLEIKTVILSKILPKTTFEMCKCLIANRISYDRNKNQNIQVISFFVTVNLVFLEPFFFFGCPKCIDAFLLDVLHGFLMDDDLELCLVMELIIFVPLRKNGFSEKVWIKFNFLHWHQLV